MSPVPPFLTALVVAASVFGLVRFLLSKPKRGKLLPGPKPLPFVGNLFHIPRELPWKAYRDWSLQYGDIIGLHLPGNQTLLILNSIEAATELLDKRAATYSDRPKSPLVDLYDWMELEHTPCSLWRRVEANTAGIMATFYTQGNAEASPYPSAGVPPFPSSTAEPDRLRELLGFSFAATTLKTMYGIDITPGDQRFVPLLHAALEGPTEAFMQGSFLVDYIPILRYVPAWVPGAGFQKKFARWRHLAADLLEKPFAEAKRSWTSGEGYYSASHEMLEAISQAQLSPATAADEERVAKIGAANVYAAGSDTTFSTLLSFFMAMAMHPEAQAKAQAELDAVVGLDRLPDHSDRDALPYVNAVVKEALRWQNVVPLGVIHRSMADDDYKCYFLPEGTLVLPNIWAMLHNPVVYPNPEIFQPERYIKDGLLNPDAPNPASVVFGFGRRICLGKNLADASLFINVASVLHTFNISVPPDGDGRPQKVDVKMSTGFLSYPSGFSCVIKPRSPAAEALILGQ